MGLTGFLETASNRAPIVVGLAIAVAVAGAWTQAPHWPFYAFTFALALLAAAIWARRGAGLLFRSREQLGFRRNRDGLAFELVPKGMPKGYYGLAFASWFAAVLAGLRLPYVGVAIAGLLLTVAWGADKRRYPSDKLTER